MSAAGLDPQPPPAGSPRRPGRRTTLLRAAFLLVAVVASVWTLRHDLDAVPAALAAIGPGRVAVAAGLVLAGVLCTAESWRACLATFGCRPDRPAARRVFFPTQLGKYVPGAVWPFVMQARLAGELGATAAVLLGTGAVFLAVHLATGAVIAAAGLPWLGGPLDGGLRWSVAFAALALVLLHPRILGLLVRLLNRAGPPPARLRWRDVLAPVGWLGPTWIGYGAAAAVLLASVDSASVDSVSMDSGGSTPVALLATATGGFALAWVAGLLVPIAPAGLGAREVVLVLVFAPVAGVAAATSVALLLRVCHVLVDVVLALGFAAQRRIRGRIKA